MYLVGAVVSREIGSYRRRARCLSLVLPSSALRCAGTTQDKSERDGRKQSHCRVSVFVCRSRRPRVPRLQVSKARRLQSERQGFPRRRPRSACDGTVKILYQSLAREDTNHTLSKKAKNESHRDGFFNPGELQVSLVSVSDSSIIDHTLHPNSHPSSICVLSSHVLKAR